MIIENAITIFMRLLSVGNKTWMIPILKCRKKSNCTKYKKGTINNKKLNQF